MTRCSHRACMRLMEARRGCPANGDGVPCVDRRLRPGRPVPRRVEPCLRGNRIRASPSGLRHRNLLVDAKSNARAFASACQRLESSDQKWLGFFRDGEDSSNSYPGWGDRKACRIRRIGGLWYTRRDGGQLTRCLRNRLGVVSRTLLLDGTRRVPTTKI